MESDNHAASDGRVRAPAGLLVLLGIVIGGMAAVIVALAIKVWSTTRAAAPPLAPSALPAPPPSPVSAPPVPESHRTTGAYWLAFVAILIASGVLFALLPPEGRVVLFWALVIGSLAVALIAWRREGREQQSEENDSAATTASGFGPLSDGDQNPRAGHNPSSNPHGGATHNPGPTAYALAAAPPADALPVGLKPRHLLIFLALLIASAVLFVVLPRAWSVGLFWALSAGLAAVGLVGYLRRPATSPALAAEVPFPTRRLRALVERQRAWLAALAVAGACVLMALSAYDFRSENFRNYGELNRAVLFLILGGVALGVGARLHRAAIPLPIPTSAALTPRRANWQVAGLGILGLVLVAEANGNRLSIGPLAGMPHQVQFWLFWLSVALVAWGLSGRDWPRWLRRRADRILGGWRRPDSGVAARGYYRATTTPQTGGSRSLPAIGSAFQARIAGLLQRFDIERGEALALLIILVVALVLRFWMLDSAVHKFIDEIHHIHAITVLWDEPQTKLFTPFSLVAAFSWLFPYFQMGAVSLFGPSLLGVRAASAVIGTLTVLAVWGLGRVWFDRKTALLAALLLAAFAPHIHFSRIGINNIADPFFGTLALACLGLGLKKNWRAGYALAGVMLGLTQYFYEGGRLFYAPLTLLFLAGVIVLWRPRAHLRGVAILVLAFVLVAAPYYYTLAADELPFFPRMDEMGLQENHLNALFHTEEGLKDQIDRIGDSLLFYVNLPDNSWFYSGDSPLIRNEAVPVFLLGVAWALWRWRRPGTLLVVLWVLAASFGNSLMWSSRDSPRFLVAFPALALLMAIGIRYTVPLLWPEGLSPRARRRWASILMAALAVFLAVAQVRYYFGEHLDMFNVRVTNGRDGLDAIFRALDFPPHTEVHIISNVSFWDIDVNTMLRFWGRHEDLPVHTLYIREFEAAYLTTLTPGVPHAFFLEPGDIETRRTLTAFFDLGEPQFSPYNIPPHQQLVLYYTPATPTGLENMHGRRR